MIIKSCVRLPHVPAIIVNRSIRTKGPTGDGDARNKGRSKTGDAVVRLHFLVTHARPSCREAEYSPSVVDTPITSLRLRGKRVSFYPTIVKGILNWGGTWFSLFFTNVGGGKAPEWL